MAKKYHTQLRNKASKMIFKIADAFKSRGKSPAEWDRPVIKPKKRFNKGGKV